MATYITIKNNEGKTFTEALTECLDVLRQYNGNEYAQLLARWYMNDEKSDYWHLFVYSDGECLQHSFQHVTNDSPHTEPDYVDYCLICDGNTTDLLDCLKEDFDGFGINQETYDFVTVEC